MIVECSNPDCQRGDNGERKIFEPQRIRERNFCSGACRTMYSRAEKQMINQYHTAVDSINIIGHFMTVRDDLTLQGDDLMMMLSNKLREYQFDKLSNKINKLQHEKQRNQGSS